MKIAIFSDTFPPAANGVAVVAAQSAKALAERGHEIWIFTVDQRSRENPFWQEGKISLTVLPSLPTGGVYEDSRLTLPLGIAWRRLKEFQPDIIHSHTPFSVGWEAVWAAKQLRKPLVGTHHTFYDHYLKHIKADFSFMKKFSWKYTALYYNLCDLVLSPSQSLADAMKANGLWKPVEVLRNPIETDIFTPGEENTKATLKKELALKRMITLVYAGRVSYEKSINQVLLSFAAAAQKNPDIELLVAGGGPDLDKLKKLAGELSVADKTVFTGQYDRGDLCRILQASDIFITASKSENMPMTIIEAMACGLPMIAVSELGLKELVRPGLNGELVPADDPSAMAQKILELAANPERLKKYSLTSRELAQEYSTENISMKLEDAYRRAINFKNKSL